MIVAGDKLSRCMCVLGQDRLRAMTSLSRNGFQQTSATWFSLVATCYHDNIMIQTSLICDLIEQRGWGWGLIINVW